MSKPLTPRERQVAALLCLGLTTAQIAVAVGTSPQTVKNQLADAYDRLGFEPYSGSPRHRLTMAVVAGRLDLATGRLREGGERAA